VFNNSHGITNAQSGCTRLLPQHLCNNVPWTKVITVSLQLLKTWWKLVSRFIPRHDIRIINRNITCPRDV